MSMAQPGIVTGIFHIILGNIPKRRKAYELKSFVEKSGVPVVQSVVHQGLGCGWVSVRGEQAFFDLGKWLEAAQWDGKSLQVDLRNHSLETPLGPSTSSPVRSRPIIPPVINRTGSIDSTYSHSYQSLETVSSPSYATSPTSSVYATPASPQQYSYQTPVPMYAPVQQVQYASTPRINQALVSPTYALPSSPTYSFSSPSVDASNQQSFNNTTQHDYPQPGSSAAPYQTRGRMIHFSRVSGAYSVVDIRNLITSVCPKNFDSPIEKVVIPKHSDGTSKDHALILMRTESLAERVVRKLHNTTPKKVRLKVKIAKDGATDCAESESIDSLPVQLEGLSMRGGSFSSGTGESSTQATSYAPTESAASDITDPSGQTTDTGRRRSSLPIANGSFSIPGTSGFLGASDAQHDGNEEAVQYGDWNAKANDKERAYKEISSAKSGHGKEKRSKGHSSKNSGREKEKRSRK